MKNEQKTEDMIEILASLSKYIPASTSKSTISFCGDQLTCERFRSAKACRAQSDTAEERLEGLIEMPTDWHALVTFYKVCTLTLL